MSNTKEKREIRKEKSKTSPLGVIFLLFTFLFISFFIFSCTNPFMERLFQPVTGTNREEIPVTVSYTVTFDSNGGSPVDSQTVAKGEKATRPNNPTKSGFGFVNWYDNEDCTEPHYDFNTPVTADITLYAKWSDTFYTVSFNSNGGIPAPEPQDVGEGGTASEPIPEPTREGHIFDGWYSDEDCTVPYDFDTPVTDHLILYAKWIAVFTVTFNSNGGSPVASQTVREGEAATRPDNPTKVEDGIEYGFVNWYDNKEFAEPHYDFDTPVTADITLYAQWNDTVYTVTFDSGGGSEVAAQRVGEDGTASRPSHDPTRSGYTFGGWYSDEDCTEAYDFNTPVTDDITLYAKWTGNTAIIEITVEQMTDLSFDDIYGGIISYSGNFYPTSKYFEYIDDDTGTYTCEWTIDGVGAYAGLITLSDTASCTVDATDPQYNSIGKHAVYLDVKKDGVPYKKTIWVEIVEDRKPVTGVTLDKTTLSLVVGGPVGTLTPLFTPPDATNQNVTWVSSNINRATVDGGTVTAVASGSVTITVTTEDGNHTATCAVTVTIPLIDVTLNKSALDMAVGGTEILTAIFTPTNATNRNVTWSISPSSVATVTNGIVNAVTTGSATITVTTADGGYIATCGITVTNSTVLNDVDFGLGATVTQTIGVANITQWNNAKTSISNGGNDRNYIINVTNNFNVPGDTAYTFGSATGIKVSLRGAYTLTLSSTGNMIRLRDNQIVILRELTLQGRKSNDTSVVFMYGGAFTMRSGKVSGNENTNYSYSAGVFVYGGIFTMRGGTISDNTKSGNGGATGGGGVSVSGSGTFAMRGGTISGNIANNCGGGVHCSGTFTMYSGTISGNEATCEDGGGVSVLGGTFTMHGGTISGNTVDFDLANCGGGGVSVRDNGTFRIVTGTIYGSTASAALRNTAIRGAALYLRSGTAQRGTFSGPGEEWVSNANLATTNATITVTNGN